jgi:predicted nucleic acid-binding Zn ribbon protein
MSPEHPDDSRAIDPELRPVVEPAEPTPPAPEPDAQPDPEPDHGPDHDDTGLDLARSIARALVRPGARRRTPSGSGSAYRPTRRVDPRASGAHPDERDPQLLDSTIGRLIAEQGWGTDVRVHGVFSRWDAIVGREVAQHCAPESFADGKLTVRTDSTAWATQMRLLAPTVVRRLNEELGDGTVTLIDVQGPHGPTWKRGPRSVRDGRGPRDTYG